MLWPILGLLLAGFVIALPATATLIRIGRRLDTLDSAGATGHRKQLRAVPNIGGVAIVLAVAVPMIVGLLAAVVLDAERMARLIPPLQTHLPRLRESAATAWALLACIAGLHVVGLVDDRRGLGPWPKLLVQIAAATILAVWFDVRLLTLLGTWPSIIVTVLWITLVTNAMNFMDNMDGLAAGVGAISAGLFMAATIVNHQWFIAATLALLVGGLLGFLVYNRPPARIFMGDGGSLVIGFLLGVLTARTTFYDPATSEYPLGSGWYALFMPVIVLAIPLYDFTTVTLIRLRQGRSPFVGDQQHFSHRLVQRGLSPRGAVAVICAAAAVTGIGGVSLGRLAGWQAVLVGVQTLAVLLMLALLEHASRRAGPEEREP